MGKYSFVESINIADYNQQGLSNTYRILYGLINYQAYLSIDINWIRIQFCSVDTVLNWRIIYGRTDAGNWHPLS